MIGRLSGKLLEKQAPELLIDVCGIGYEVQAPMTTFYGLPDIGNEVILYTHFVVREDAQQLYGFAKKQDREVFRLLIKVNGIGPKLALTILSNFEANDFMQCILNENEHALIRIPGIGQKTAGRLILDMRDRVKNWFTDSIHQTTFQIDTQTMPNTYAHPTQEAIGALITLGYKPQEATRAISKIKQDDLTCEQMIRLALQSFAN